VKAVYVRCISRTTNKRIPAVRGVAVGPFVVHRTPKRWLDEGYGQWRVTHKLSGLLASWDATKAGAMKKARALVAHGKIRNIDWRFKTLEESRTMVAPETVLYMQKVAHEA
jgi:hypothetical protein